MTDEITPKDPVWNLPEDNGPFDMDSIVQKGTYYIWVNKGNLKPIEFSIIDDKNSWWDVEVNND